MEYVTNPFIINSYAYYKSLDENAKILINQYNAEMDASDWSDKPLDITYTVANWILQHRVKYSRYIPNLLKEHALTKEQFINQIINANTLVKILELFPRNKGINSSITVFRGERLELEKYIHGRKQISLFSFLSTSLNLKVANAFNKGTLLVITIPPGNPLPFISDHLSTNYPTGPESSESEILLPPGSTFIVDGYTKNVTVLGKTTYVFYLTLLRFGQHDTRGTWNRYSKNTNKLYNEVCSKLYPENNVRNINNNSTRRGGHTKRNKSRKNKRNST